MSGKFSINKGVIQGDLMSLTLFTTGMEEIFTTADISEGINVKTENTSQTQGLPVMLTSSTKKNPKQMERRVNGLNSQSLKNG